MKHLLNGVAIAAVFAIAAPALAQNAPMTPASPPAKSAPAPKAAASAPAKASTAMPKKPMHRMVRRRGGGMANEGDRMTEELNRQELARLSGGGAPMPPSGGPAPMGGNAPTSGAAGPFAPSGGGTSAPPPPPSR